MDTNGVVTVDQAIGEFLGNETAFTQAEAPQVGISSLIRAALDGAAGEIVIMFDPVERKVFVADPAANLAGLFTADCGTAIKTFTPNTGQTGRSLTWVAGDAGAGFPAGVNSTIDPLVDAADPKRTLSSLLNSLFSGVKPEMTPNPYVVVDQNTKTVSVIESGGAGDPLTALAAMVSSAVQDAAYCTLTDQAGPGDNPLPFEGGAV